MNLSNKFIIIILIIITSVVSIFTYIQVNELKEILNNQLNQRVSSMRNNLESNAKYTIKSLKNDVENDIASFNFSHINKSFGELVSDKNIDTVLLSNSDKTMKLFAGTYTFEDELAKKIIHNLKIQEINSGNNFIISIPIVLTHKWGEMHIVYSLKELKQEISKTQGYIANKITKSIEKAIYTAIIIALFLVIFSYFFAKKFIEPILLLTKIAKKIANGNLEVSDELSTINTNDEIGLLSKTFKDLSEKLDKSHREWKNLNESLEVKIEERTKDLEIQKYKAESATKTKSEFLANMSHEIRTPMHGIIGMSYLALQSNLNQKQKRYIQKIDNNAKLLLGILNDILDFSKIEAGKLTIEKVEFDLYRVVNSVVELIEFKAEEKNLEIIVSYGSDIDRDYYGDNLRISQILTNLMSNAVKFTSRGEIGVHIHEISKDRVRFEVTDTGIGLTKEEQGRLFYSFSQADGSTTRKYGGTGLGLSISKQLVELMNGKIWIESEVDVGSKFIFEIELRALKYKHIIYQTFVNKKVLIVENNLTWREILASLLESFEIEVDVASSGTIALNKISSYNKHYDLILMDCNMPQLNGIETAKLIHDYFKESTPPTIVMLSTFMQDSIIQQAKDIGIEIFLQKPVNPLILNDILSDNFLEGAKKYYSNQAEEKSPKNDISVLRGSKILLAEDNKTNQEIIIGLLENSGIDIDIANNGQEAVDKFKEHDYELILMDLRMPVMNGYEATKIIRGIDSDIKIIALTANAMKEDVDRTREIGMNEHIKKPIDVEKFYEMLLKYIKHKGGKSSSLLVATADEASLEIIQKINTLDTELGLKYLMGNTKLYLKILKDFYNNYYDFKLEDLEEEEFKRATHTLKSLSANIGAIDLHSIVKELDETQNDKNKIDLFKKTFLVKFYEELKKVLDELKTLNYKEKKDEEKKKEISAEEKDELFKKLIDAIKTSRPLNCEEVMQKLQICKLLDKDNELLETVNSLIKRYNFKEALEIMELR